MVAVGCEQVWPEISNYIDGEVDPALRSALDEHFGRCARCTAVLEGTRNIVQLYGDERLFEAPLGYSWRLKRRLQAEARPARRLFLGWAVASAAAALVAGTIGLARWSGAPVPPERSEHAQPGKGVPPNLEVLANVHGRLFHIEGCPFLNANDGIKNLTAKEAEAEGYVPCVRCLGEYVKETAVNFLHKAWRSV
jgi:hypothetical protein